MQRTVTRFSLKESQVLPTSRERTGHIFHLLYILAEICSLTRRNNRPHRCFQILVRDLAIIISVEPIKELFAIVDESPALHQFFELGEIDGILIFFPLNECPFDGFELLESLSDKPVLHKRCVRC